MKSLLIVFAALLFVGAGCSGYKTLTNDEMKAKKQACLDAGLSFNVWGTSHGVTDVNCTLER